MSLSIKRIIKRTIAAFAAGFSSSAAVATIAVIHTREAAESVIPFAIAFGFLHSVIAYGLIYSFDFLSENAANELELRRRTSRE